MTKCGDCAYFVSGYYCECTTWAVHPDSTWCTAEEYGFGMFRPRKRGTMFLRKKPVVVEGKQICHEDDFATIAEWCGGYVVGVVPACWLEIETLEGIHRADLNDWVLKGVKGEFYPVKPDIVDLTYDIAGYDVLDLLEPFEARLIREYRELVDRRKKLGRMLDDWDYNKLDFTPECTKDQLKLQYHGMMLYEMALRARNDFQRLYNEERI